MVVKEQRILSILRCRFFCIFYIDEEFNLSSICVLFNSYFLLNSISVFYQNFLRVCTEPSFTEILIHSVQIMNDLILSSLLLDDDYIISVKGSTKKTIIVDRKYKQFT